MHFPGRHFLSQKIGLQLTSLPGEVWHGLFVLGFVVVVALAEELLQTVPRQVQQKGKVHLAHRLELLFVCVLQPIDQSLSLALSQFDSLGHSCCYGNRLPPEKREKSELFNGKYLKS